jgi:hypothetical protein
MFEFLVETYATRESHSSLAKRVGELARAAERVSESEQADVRLLGAVSAPEEETCFYLYQSVSADAVREAARSAGLQPERITKAFLIRAPAHLRSNARSTPPPMPEK